MTDFLFLRDGHKTVHIPSKTKGERNEVRRRDDYNIAQSIDNELNIIVCHFFDLNSKQI